MRDPLHSIGFAEWRPDVAVDVQAGARRALEEGRVLHLPRLRFDLDPSEARFLDASWSLGSAKNISLRPGTRDVRGARGADEDLAGLAAMMERYAQAAEDLIDRVIPAYREGRSRGSTSFRPCEIGDRKLSWRRDDTRLHVDSFPSNPVRDKRILRVFSNVDVRGRPRRWLLGETFPSFAARFFPRAHPPIPGSARALHVLGITKRERSAYDHYMLQLHDLAKADERYQQETAREEIDFAAGSTWIAFTDQVVHAATRGQHAFEQTFYVDVASLGERKNSPLAILEGLARRSLTA